MKINGESVKRYVGTFRFQREIEGKVRPVGVLVKQLPATWIEDVEVQLPEPEPPVSGWQENKDGQRVDKYDYKDAGYRQAHREWEHRVAAKKIHDATIDDGISWETDPEIRTSDPARFYSGIWDELAEGFSRREINGWVRVIDLIDLVGGADIAIAENELFRELESSAELQEMEAEEGAGGE